MRSNEQAIEPPLLTYPRHLSIREFNGMQGREFLSPYAHGDRNSVPVTLFFPCSQGETAISCRIIGY